MRRLKFLILFALALLLLGATLWRFPVPMHGAVALLQGAAAAGLLLVVALGLGRSLLQRFKLYHGSLVQEAGFSLGLGLAFLSLLGSALGAAGVLYVWVAWIVAVLGLIVSWEQLEALADTLRRALRSKHPWEGSSNEIAVLLALGLSLATIVMLTLAPPTFYDALVYHLAQAQRAAQSGKATPQAGVLFTWLPSLAEPLWTLALLLDGAPDASVLAAALLNLAVGLALGLAIMDASARLLSERRLWLAPALAFTQPLLALTFGVFSPDGWVAWYAFLSLHAFVLALGERVLRHQAAWLLLSAVLAGAAVACKPVALLHAAALLLLAGGLAVTDKAWRRPGLLLAGAGLFLVPLLPWLLRGGLLLGEPFYPFPVSFMGRVLATGAPASYFEHVESFGGAGWRAWLSLPLAPFFDPASLGGAGHLGFLLLVLVPASLLWQAPRELRWVGAYVLVGACLWALGPHVLRYALFLVPAASLLAAHGVLEAEAWAVSRTWTLLWRGVVLAGLFVGSFHTLTIAVKDFDPLPVALGLEKPADYLWRRGVPQLRAADWIRSHGGEASKVLVLGDARTAWLPPAILASSVFEPHPLAAWVGQAAGPQQVGATVRRKGYDFVVFNAAEWDRVRASGPMTLYWPTGDESARLRFFAWLEELRALPPDKRLVDGPLLVAHLR